MLRFLDRLGSSFQLPPAKKEAAVSTSSRPRRKQPKDWVLDLRDSLGWGDKSALESQQQPMNSKYDTNYDPSPGGKATQLASKVGGLALSFNRSGGCSLDIELQHRWLSLLVGLVVSHILAHLGSRCANPIACSFNIL